MVNPLHPPNILIHVDDFLYSPFIAEEGETNVEGLYCVQCWLELNEVVELIELWRSPEIGIAYCPLCNQETIIQSTFEELRKEVKLKLDHEEWRIYKYREVKILELIKSSQHKLR